MDGGRIVILVPDENERDMEDWLEGDEFQMCTGRDDGFGDDAKARAGFHIDHHRADEAGRMREPRNHARLTAARDHGVMQADAFAAGENDEWLPRQGRPGKCTLLRKGVIGRDDNAEPLLLEWDRTKADRFVNEDRARDSGGEAALGDHFPDALRGAFLQMDGNARVAFAIVMQKAAEEWFRGWPNVTEAAITSCQFKGNFGLNGNSAWLSW